MDVNTADVVLCEFYFSDLKASKNRPVLVLKNTVRSIKAILKSIIDYFVSISVVVRKID